MARTASTVSDLRRFNRWRLSTFLLVTGMAVMLPSISLAQQSKVVPATKELDKSLSIDIPTSVYKMEFVLVPGDDAKGIKPFYMSTTEVTWDAFDVYVYRLDDPNAPPAGKGADAVTHPSKSYLPPDRGFGHENFAAITISHKNARTFCEWLSMKSGKKVRLASDSEWQHACELGDKGDKQFTTSTAKEFAWYVDNAEEKTHKVASLKPNALGIFDMRGNVAEWVTGSKGEALTKGGSFQDGLDKIKDPSDTVPHSPDWNGSDPQIPKSKWWLADGPMIGFRVVVEPQEAKIEAKPETKPEEKKPVRE